jgi:uncharacterized protein YqjF (DUF2071 family)
MAMTSTGLMAAERRDLVMISYEVDPVLLVPYVPGGTSLDFHQRRALVTVVGMRLLNTRMAGVPVPFHSDLEQVNFRFNVWRQARHELRRGVVFIKEIVPSASMTLGARLFFNENYVSAPMRHQVVHAEQGFASYEWQAAGRWHRVSARQHGTATPADATSVESFVKDRPWGYSRQRDGSTLEYYVEHSPWDISPAIDPVLDCDVREVFGRQFVSTLARPPVSAFIAVGSEATLHPGRPVD